MNGNYPVSEAARARVQKAVRELGYQPNAVAQGLRRQKTYSVGVLIPKVNDPFFSTFAYTVEKMLLGYRYRTLLCSTDEDAVKESDYVDLLLRQQVDGVILFPNPHSRDNVERLLNEQIPVVVVERDIPDLPLQRVLVTNRKGSYSGVRHLVELGHREISIISSSVTTTPMSIRFQGAMDAYNDYGLVVRPGFIVTANSAPNRFDLGYRNAMEVLKGSSRPTAIFALTDEIAIGALEAMQQLGIRVPEDISLVGFDNILMTSFLTPKLTTVSQPIEQMGMAAGTLLMHKLEKNDHGTAEVTLETQLVVRQSTAPPINVIAQ